jgi:hypothetical protein
MKRENVLYARFGLQLVSHPGALAAKEDAMGLYVFCMLYSRTHELDGKCPRDAAEMGWSGDRKANRRRLQLLCSPQVGYMRETEDGYEILKFAEFNETKADIEERRAKTRERVGRHRNACVTPPGTSDVTRYRPVTEGVSNAFVPVSVSVSLSGSDQDLDPDRARAEPAPRAPETPGGAFVAAASSSETPAPDDILITPEIEANCVMAGAPKPTKAHVVAMLASARGKRKVSHDWGAELVSWMCREPSFSRSRAGPKRMVQPVPEGGPIWKVGNGE